MEWCQVNGSSPFFLTNIEYFAGSLIELKTLQSCKDSGSSPLWWNILYTRPHRVVGIRHSWSEASVKTFQFLKFLLLKENKVYLHITNQIEICRLSLWLSRGIVKPKNLYCGFECKGLYHINNDLLIIWNMNNWKSLALDMRE